MLPPHLIQSALESAPDAIVIIDPSGHIVFVNARVTTLFRYDREELLGRPVEHLLPEYLPARPTGAGLGLGGRRKDGTEFPVEVSLSPIRDRGSTLVAAAIRDVTDRRRIEAELRTARDEADRANRAKSRFLATASHDLRQPLQALSLLNGTLRRLAIDAGLSEALAQQEQAIAAMSRLVNALLDISKLESGAIQPEITDFTVASIFEELRREFASLAATKGLELQVEACDAVVRSDPSLVEQILRNLVSNAIKYTRRGRVLLRCLHEPAVVRLEVLDTGIGIPADQVPYIFDEFFQVGVAANTTRDGYGLGLSIVSRVVRLLDLRLDVDSEPGRGSSFRLAVPASSGRSSAHGGGYAPGTSPEQPRKNHGLRILLVEDDAGVRNATRMLLAAEGHGVVTAVSRVEALERLGERPPPDLLIADYHLGGDGTGVDVITAARARIGPTLPVILLTGDTSADVRALHRDELWRIASKPLNAGELLTLIGELRGR